MPIDWKPLVELVARCERFLLTSHMRPDCDAMGSELGMSAILRALGKEVVIVNGDPVPWHLGFIDPRKQIQVLGDDVQAGELNQFDAMMILDTSSRAQLGPMADVMEVTSAEKVVIDHHVSDDDFGALTFKDTSAAAAGLLVIEAAEVLGVDLTAEMAAPLFAAVATDTGWFRFSSVDGETYRAVGKLVDAGANPAETFTTLYERDTIARVLLRGKILGKAATDNDGRVIYSTVELRDFAETGAEKGDTEEVINMLLRVVGTQVALLFIEMEAGGVKVSLRSRSEFDVRKIAEQFGGGGHTQAAGVSLDMPLGEATQTILDAVGRAME